MAGAGSKRLELELTARDMTGGAFESASSNMDRYTGKSKRGFKEMTNAAMSYTKLVGSIITAKVLSRGFAYLEEGIRDVAVNIVDMDQALTAASAKFGPNVKKGTDAFAEMQLLTRDIAATTEYTASETASAIDFLGMAGFQFGSAMQALRPLTDLATASQMDFARASDIASDALGAFNMSIDAENVEGNLNRINDVFAKTVTTSNTTMETLFDTMKLAGPVVRGGVEMFGTLAGTLGSAGIKGTIAATTMKNMFLRLQAPPSEAKKALRKLKIEIDDGNGSMKDMITIIGELNTALADKNEIKREQFLKDIFGMRAISGVNVLLRKGETALRAYHKELSNSQGAAKEMADTMRQGLGTQLKVLQSTLIAKGFSIFDALMGERDPVDAVKELVEVIRNYDIGPLVSRMKDLADVAKSLASFLWENQEAFVAIGKVFIFYSIQQKFMALNGIIGSFGSNLQKLGGPKGALGKISPSLGGFGKTLGGLAKGLSAAMGPISAALVAAEGLRAIFDALEERAKRKVEEENAAIKKYRGAKDLTVEQATKEKKGIEGYFENTSGLKESRRQLFRNVQAGTMSESVAQQFLKDEPKLRQKVEYYFALQRRLGQIRSGNTWVGNAAQNERLRAMMNDYAANADMRSVDVQTPWATEWEQANTLPTTSMFQSGAGPVMPEIKWEPKQTFDIQVNIEGQTEGITATATMRETTPLSDKTLGAANG